MNSFERIAAYPARVICEAGYGVDDALFDKKRPLLDRILMLPVLIIAGFLYGLLTTFVIQLVGEGQNFQWDFKPVDAMSIGLAIVFGPWLLLRFVMWLEKQR